MANIHDYLLWRGDLPINQDFKFNEIDSMILARFSYLLFDKIKMEEQETIESISKKMKDFENEEFLYNGDKELITYLGESERFKNLIVTDYASSADKDIEKQFGAITIHISESEMYISYIGTDSSINGWKEDFNMAFMDNVPCQIVGLKYLEQEALKYSNKKIRIGGHSKGGNVAIYAAIAAKKSVQDRLIKVDNYDGPGFSREIIDMYGNQDILNRIETFIPQESIIGRVLNHKEKMTISFSVEKGVLQHDIYSWQVLKDEMIKSEKSTGVSEDVNKTVIDWLEKTTNEQRKIFIDTIFELVYSTQAESFSEITKSLSTSIPKILKKYKETTPEDKKIITEMIRTFVSSYIKVIREKEKEKIHNKKNEYIKIERK